MSWMKKGSILLGLLKIISADIRGYEDIGGYPRISVLAVNFSFQLKFFSSIFSIFYVINGFLTLFKCLHAKARHENTQNWWKIFNFKFFVVVVFYFIGKISADIRGYRRISFKDIRGYPRILTTLVLTFSNNF